MQPDTSVSQPGSRGMPGAGTSRWSQVYFDESGRQRMSRHKVPVDQYGRVVGQQFKCRKCEVGRWFPSGLKAAPVCEVHDRQMVVQPLRSAPLLPWLDLWRAVEPPLRPVWPFAAALPAAVALHEAASMPAWALSATGLVLAEAVRRVVAARLVQQAKKKGRISDDDPDGERRHRATLAKRSRVAAYGTLAGAEWLALATATGVDPHMFGSAVSLAAWPLVTAASAVPWWRWLAGQRNRPTSVIAEQPPPGVQVDPLEVEVRRKWTAILAVEQGETAGVDAHGQPVKTKRAGKLAGTWLEGWHRVEGGWAATAVGPPGAYTSESFLAARGAIASTFNMKASMVTVIPDEDDESRALVSTQRTTAIRDTVRWAGPDSVDVAACRAPIAQYKDGTLAYYELYRPDWGTPHDFLCGTTGAGKSDTLSLLLTIDRWASYVDVNGVRRGLVADLLIDPQQGQSYGPFVDDLAAPMACTLDEAMLLVQALRQEMFRRNRYLARVEWPDPRRRKRDGSPVMRKGRKWWNPLVDGPIITLNIDEAHEYLAHKPFAALVTSGARMYRKCGIRIRVATHTPLLSDLGGSMALRDMLTGGFVWVGRTANSLSGPVAFNGRLQVDPRTIPEVPGMAFLLSGLAPKPMLVRSMWEPDFYDWVRDDQDEPVGYPATLPPETVAAFGKEYAAWVAHMADPNATPWDAGAGSTAKASPSEAVVSVDAVFSVLAAARGSLDMDTLNGELVRLGHRYATKTIRDAVKRLRDQGQVQSANGRHELTAQTRIDHEAKVLAAQELATADGGAA